MTYREPEPRRFLVVYSAWDGSPSHVRMRSTTTLALSHEAAFVNVANTVAYRAGWMSAYVFDADDFARGEGWPFNR